MKKGKVFGKHHVLLALMVLALGGAVWLNMKFTSTEKYMGEATFVNGDISNESAVQTSADADEETDYFEKARSDRQKALDEAQELVEETLKSANVSDAEREKALKTTSEIAKRIERANNIETLLKAKGFDKALAVIGEDSVTVIIGSDGLVTSQTVQIQDAVMSVCNINLNNIKIVTVNS